MKTVVLTSDNRNWLLRGFFHQWARYFDQYASIEVEVAGFTRPAYLPKYATFFSIGKFEDYPINAWSDGLIKYLNAIPDELVLIFLEDYWLMRPVNRRVLSACCSWMEDHKDVIRFDVAADRMFNKQARYIGSFGILDICEAKGDYSLSFQASIFRKSLLLEVLQSGETPWQTEINGSERLNRLPYKVCGSYQWPLMYMIVVNKGQVDMTGSWMYPARSLSQEDWRLLREASCLPEKDEVPE